MSEKEVFDKLVEIVSESLEDESLKDHVSMDTNIFTDLNMNSIAMIYIAMAIEDTFNIKINNDDVKHNLTVRDWVNYILSRM